MTGFLKMNYIVFDNRGDKWAVSNRAVYVNPQHIIRVELAELGERAREGFEKAYRVHTVVDHISHSLLVACEEFDFKYNFN